MVMSQGSIVQGRRGHCHWNGRDADAGMEISGDPPGPYGRRNQEPRTPEVGVIQVLLKADPA